MGAGVNNAVMFGRATDEWRTPESFFCEMAAEFAFDVDAASTAENGWVDGEYFGPDHHYPEQRDALAVPNWRVYGKTFWLNPPYSQCRAFIAKAAEEARKGCTVVCLVPARTDTRWWHASVWNAETHQPRPGVELRFLKGRLKYGGATEGAPFPSVLIIFRPAREHERLQ